MLSCGAFEKNQLAMEKTKHVEELIRQVGNGAINKFP